MVGLYTLSLDPEVGKAIERLSSYLVVQAPCCTSEPGISIRALGLYLEHNAQCLCVGCFPMFYTVTLLPYTAQHRWPIVATCAIVGPSEERNTRAYARCTIRPKLRK